MDVKIAIFTFIGVKVTLNVKKFEIIPSNREYKSFFFKLNSRKLH